jgi:hypothetical protein
MLKQLALTAAIATAVALAATGCVKAPIDARADSHYTRQIDLTDSDLRDDTAVGTPIVTRDPEGQLLNVTVPIRAATNRQLYVDYRVTFLDAYGQVVSQTGWLNKTLAPNVFDQITFNSMSPRAADFRLDLRYAK